MGRPAPLEHLKYFFEVRLQSVQTTLPLKYDLYLFVNEKPTLFRNRGEVLTNSRISALIGHGGEKFWVPNDQRVLYLQSLKEAIRSPDSSTETKASFIKETAYLHVHDLFTKEDVSPVLPEATSLVEEMVQFVSTDVEAISSLMRLSVHDYYTYNHCVDVAVYSIALARKIVGDSREELLCAGLGGLLHDIGKRKIDWGIINKTKPLSHDEWAEIRKHPIYGRDYLRQIPTIPEDTQRIVYEHHENFDGTGYPDGIKDEAISKLAKVVTIADVFDALTTDRSYHKAISPTEALNTMYSMQPGKFDPAIFQSFNRNFSNKKAPLSLPKDFDPCQPQSVVKLK